jgi:hypothetical protein
MQIVNELISTESFSSNKVLNSLRNVDTKIACGIPVFLPNELFFQSLHSLLAQTVPLSIVLLDDCSPGSDKFFSKIVEEFGNHSSLYLIKREKRVGQLINTREVREICKFLFPNLEFYFLGSDHDIWNTNFLENSLNAFSQDNAIALVAPGGKKITVHEASLEFEKYSRRNSLYKVTNNSPNLMSKQVSNRIISSSSQLSAGNMIYGVEKIGLTANIPYYEYVLGPDRLFLLRVLMQHKIFQSEDVTWLRVVTSKFSAERQLRNLFSQIPSYTPKFLYRLYPDLHHAWMILATKKYRFQDRFLMTVVLLSKIVISKTRKVRKRLRTEFTARF